MGQISDFVLLDPSSIPTRFPGWIRPAPGWIPSGEETETDLEGLDVVQHSGVTIVMLGILVEATVRGGALAEYVSPSAEQMLTQLPHAVTAALAELNGAGRDHWIDRVVGEWKAELETVEGGGASQCTREEWAPMLIAITDLARRCRPPYVLAMHSSI